MTLLDKIDFLLAKNGLNKRQFSIKSGIPYTTIDGFYKNGYKKMQLSTFRTLCDYFNVTMDSMAYDDKEIVYITPEYKKKLIISDPDVLDFVDSIHRLNASGREKLREDLVDMLELPKYTSQKNIEVKEA